jgi:antitoxin YefM
MYSKYVQKKEIKKEAFMAIQATYTEARANFAKLLDEVTKNRETVIIKRRGQEKVAMIAETELSSLLETAYLLRSPKNAERLITALERALKGKPKPKPMTIEKLRLEVGLGSEKS